jgi:hypothetical protein
MIERGTEFNLDGRNWRVMEVVSVQYVNFQGYVVTVWATKSPLNRYHKIDLYANGTPIGYHD